MSNDPDPAPVPSVPPPAPMPELKRALPPKDEAKPSEGRGALYSAGVTVLMIAIGIGAALWNAKPAAPDPQPQPAVPKVDLDRLALRELERQGKTEPARTAIKNATALAAKVRFQEDAERVQKLLIETEKLAKKAAPDLLADVQQAQRDLELGLQQNRFPKRPDPERPKADAVPVAPPPREVKR